MFDREGVIIIITADNYQVALKYINSTDDIFTATTDTVVILACWGHFWEISY